MPNGFRIGLHKGASQLLFLSSVARWFVFVPKIPIWVNFRGPWNGKVSIFYGRVEYFTVILYIL
jgi:hypothetical protein